LKDQPQISILAGSPAGDRRKTAQTGSMLFKALFFFFLIVVVGALLAGILSKK